MQGLLGSPDGVGRGFGCGDHGHCMFKSKTSLGLCRHQLCPHLRFNCVMTMELHNPHLPKPDYSGQPWPVLRMLTAKLAQAYLLYLCFSQYIAIMMTDTTIILMSTFVIFLIKIILKNQ